MLRSLHRLPLWRRIVIKTVTRVWKCIGDAAVQTPAYLQELCVAVDNVQGRPPSVAVCVD